MNMEPSDNPSETDPTGSNRVLVCGLGSLGQYSAAALKAFGVSVSAIDLTEPPHWEIPELPQILEQLIIADCRLASVLERAGIHRCRAVLLVTGNERVNLESAFAVHSLNPRARLVVRSSKQNLNSLLSQQFGNFAAYEATEVTAPAFATAALGGDVIGWFEVGDQSFRAIKRTIALGNVWCNRRGVGELNTSFRRVLAHLTPDSSTLTPDLAAWDPDQPIQAGDIVFALEASDWRALPAELAPSPSQPESKPGGSPLRLWRWIRNRVSQFWKTGGPRRVVVVAGVFLRSRCCRWARCCSGSRCPTTNRGMVSTPRSFSYWAVTATCSAVWNRDCRFPGGCGCSACYSPSPALPWSDSCTV